MEGDLTLLDQSQEMTVESPTWDLAPSVARVAAVDAALRRRLACSLAYLAELASLHSSHDAHLQRFDVRLRSGPVSPWVFCLYSELVAKLAKAPGSDVSRSFAEIVQAAELPADGGLIAFRAPTLPSPWWDHAHLLFDTDRKRPFRPQAPAAEAFAFCKQDIELGFAVLKRGDPVWYKRSEASSRRLCSAPRPVAIPLAVSTGPRLFSLGRVFLNSALRRSSLAMADLLIHESSHTLLFGVSDDGALTENSGHERSESSPSAKTSGRSMASFTRVLWRPEFTLR